MPIMKFGKYKDLDIAEVPDDYLAWLIRDSEDRVNVYRIEQQRRKMRVDGSFMTQIVDRGFKILSADPLSPEELRKLNMAHQLLLQAIADAGAVKDPNPPF